MFTTRDGLLSRSSVQIIYTKSSEHEELMKILRAIASIVVFLILSFFLIGLNASNDWDEGGGTLAKIIIVPICFVLGLILFKLAAPLFGWSGSQGSRASVESRTRKKISDNRYRMGNDLPTSYGLAGLGILILLLAISRRDWLIATVAFGILFYSIQMRARLQSEKRAAKSLGARTLEDDVVDTVVGIGEVTGQLAKFAVERGLSGLERLATKFESSELEIDSVRQSEVSQGIGFSGGSPMRSFEETGAIDLLAQLGVPREDLRNATPVVSARHLLMMSWQVFSADRSSQGVESAQFVILTAMKALAWTLNSGGGVEMMAGGRIVAEPDAYMWYGICAGLLVPPNEGQLELGPNLSRPSELADVADVMALAHAHDIYVQSGDLKRAGRCAHEVAEIMRLRSAPKADRWFDRAAELFSNANLADRREAVAKSRQGSTRESSPFFHGAFGPGPATVAGSLEYFTMASATYLAG